MSTKSPSRNLRGVALAVAMSILVVTAGCSALPGGDGGGTTTASVDSVPAGVDSVATVDVAGILADENHRSIANTVFNLSAQQPFYEGPANVSAALEEARDSSDLDPSGLNNVVAFGAYPEGGSSADAGYGAVIVGSSWEEAALIETIRNQSDATVTEGEYGGATVYTTEGSEEGTIGVLADGKYVFGTTAAVEDVIDVDQGNADALSGSLRTAYEDSHEGYVRFAATVPQDSASVPGGAAPGGVNVSDAFQKITMVSGAHYTDGDSVGVTTTLHAEDSSAASDIQSTIDGLVSIAQGTVEDPDLTAVIDSVSVSEPDGSTVTITYEQSTSEIEDLVRTYFEQALMGAAASSTSTSQSVGAGAP